MVVSFSSVQAFFHMGGYAAYLWPTYIIVLFSLCFNAVLSKRRLNRLLKKQSPLKTEKHHEKKSPISVV